MFDRNGVTMNAQRHGRRAHTLSRTKQIVLITRHYPVTMFDSAFPDDVVNEIDQRVRASFDVSGS